MNTTSRWIAIALLACCLPLASCSHAPDEAAAAEEGGPAKVEHLLGDQPTRVTLTEDAAKRLDVQTDLVRSEMIKGEKRTTMPYAAVLYDTEGNTWTYVSTGPLVFMRHRIVVDFIDGEVAVLLEGPAIGSAVVTVGAEELFGSELEFEEE